MKTLCVLLGITACAMAACTLKQPLREAADKHGLFFGAILANGHMGDNQYMALSKQQFNLVTAENECKFDAMEPQRGNFNYNTCDKMYNRAIQDNQTFRGHNLCWGQQVPGWVNGLSADQKREALKNHVKNVVNHYKGKKGFYCWDVVNEAVDNSGTKLKSTVWYPSVPDYIDVAFTAAHEADPNVKLFYNDYGADGVNTKSNYIFNMVQSMKQRGVPIDGVGLQMHVAVSGHPSVQDLRNNLKRFGDIGLEVHITELDVKGGSQSAQQAQVYKDLITACLAEPCCKSFQTWGIIDKYSWVGDNEKALLFNDQYQPKDAACSVLDVLLK
jgi:endo-1,4-beta-xylanase